MIEFTKKDILRGTLVEPAWYRMKIEGLEKKISAKGDSTNYNYECSIIKNADNGDTKFQEVPLTINFNSKAIGFMKDFFTSLGGEVVPGSRFDEAAAVGKEIEAYIINEEYEGRQVNKCKHQYRAAKEAAAIA